MSFGTISTRLFAVLASFVAAVEIACFRTACLQSLGKVADPNALEDGLLSSGNVVLIIVVTAALTAACWLFMRYDDAVFKRCFKYRYPIAAALLVLLVALDVSGSSIGMFTNYLGGDAGDYLGVPRNIRRDEWVVNTPLALSQAQTGFSPISSVATGGDLNLTLVYAQACWHPSTLFRPFLWGYLVLPASYGLSFFWCARLVALFMVSFEFGRLLANDNRRLALIYAALVTFSPLVQWWFAVNFIAEILVFSQLLVLLFRGLLTSVTRKRTLAYAAGIAYCAAAFALALYPAWQVQLGYFIVGLCLTLLVRSARMAGNARATARRVGVLIAALAVAVAVVGGIVLSSADVVSAVLGSEYPGARLEVGGGLGDALFDYALALIAVLDHAAVLPNACEMAGMFGLFPLGIVLGAVLAVRKRDGILIALLAIEAIFLAFGLFGFPAPLAKILLLSNVTAHRLTLGVGLADIMLIVRSLALVAADAPTGRKLALRTAAALVAAAVLAAVAVFSASQSLDSTVSAGPKLLSALFVGLGAYAVLSACLGTNEKLRQLLCMAALVALVGLMVNPVQAGLSRFYETPLATAVEQVESEDADARSSLWLADDSIVAQACIAYGVPTLNSVALYPHYDAWASIDPEGANLGVYNRYAHIKAKPTSEATSFTLTFYDAFTVRLNTRSLKELGVAYWVTERRLERYNDDVVQFELAQDAGPYRVYHLRYTQ